MKVKYHYTWVVIKSRKDPKKANARTLTSVAKIRMIARKMRNVKIQDGEQKLVLRR